MKRYIIFIIISFLFAFSYGKSKQDLSHYEIEIAEIGQPGTLVIKTWCYSKKPNIGEEVFKEYAIKGVMFKGVNDSGRMKGRKALIEDGYDSHKDYFDIFFKNKEYEKYARVAMNGYVEQNSFVKVGKVYKVGKIVVVSFNELRTKLETDRIIKGLNTGF